MSSKKKKPVSSWVQCDQCQTLLMDRDSNLHENDCPPNTKLIRYHFIQNRKLFCKSNYIISVSAVPHDTSSFIYMSNIALQLCEIPVGDNVLITFGSGESVVRKAWRDNDKQQLTASWNENDIKFYTKSENNVLKVELLTQSIAYGCEVSLIGFTESVEDVLTCLKHSNNNRIFSVGDNIQMSYYGKKINFKINGIKADTNEFQGKFFKVSLNTVWKIDDGLKPTESNLVRIGGLHDVITDIDNTIEIALRQSQTESMLIPRGILLHGPSGTGKSLLINYIASQWLKRSVTAVKIHCDYNLSTLKTNLKNYVNQAKTRESFLIFIDDLDVICAKKSSDEYEIMSILASFFDQISTSASKVVVIGTCCKISNIDQSLRRPGRFDKELEICVPTPQQRFNILNAVLENKRHGISKEEISIVADKSHGFVGADLMSLLHKASALASSEDRLLSGQHLLQCLPQVKPSAMREIMIQVPNVRWEDIGGQSELKHQLRQAVEWPLKYPESFRRLGVSPPRGLLMYGPPGCSKTMVAKALATESGLNFISVKGPELFSKWVGESEKAIREIFRRARQAAPSIVFFDELDALAGERTSASGNQVQERVLAQLLTELDGVEALGHVIVVGATNRPDRIDAALLRPGRLDRVVYVPLPDYDTRSDIFLIRLKNTSPAADVDVKEMAHFTDGYSGAEICAICNEAALSALDEDMQAKQVSRKHFLSALKIVAPRTSPNTLKLFEEYKNLF